VLRNMGNMIIDGDLSCDTTIRHAVVDLQVVLAPKIIASSFVLPRLGGTHRRLRPLRVSSCESNCERWAERSMVEVSHLLKNFVNLLIMAVKQAQYSPLGTRRYKSTSTVGARSRFCRVEYP
jgi:hypothetical protein